MLVVGICDDDKIWLEESKEIIIKFAQKTKIELQIQCFSNKTQLLGYSGTPLDALFLDIELGNNEIKSVYLIATRDLSNLWLQFFLSQNQGFMRLFEKTVLK